MKKLLSMATIAMVAITLSCQSDEDPAAKKEVPSDVIAKLAMNSAPLEGSEGGQSSKRRRSRRPGFVLPEVYLR